MSAKKSAKDYEQIGRIASSFYELNAISRRRFVTVNFTKGLLIGLGSVIGATLAITLLVWFLSWFEQVPLVGNLFLKVQNSIEQQR